MSPEAGVEECEGGEVQTDRVQTLIHGIPVSHSSLRRAAELQQKARERQVRETKRLGLGKGKRLESGSSWMGLDQFADGQTSEEESQEEESRRNRGRSGVENMSAG